MSAKTKMCSGIVERVGMGNGIVKYQRFSEKEIVENENCANHAAAIKKIISLLTDPNTGVIDDVGHIDALGHRVVHGGEKFARSVTVDSEVMNTIEECSQLAPLHNPANLTGIRASLELMPNVPNMAVFDTAFFYTLRPHTFIYALPYEWYKKYGIRRYGFHGTSHLYVSKRASVILRKKPLETNLITLHIGNGVSVTAVKCGAAYDHSMGFSPLEGAVMGTRCGDIDPSIPLYVMSIENLKPAEMDQIVNKRSGLLGITGKYVDRRDILKAASEGDERAKLAIEIECYRLRKYIGAYLAALGRVDAIVFTAGVGENSVLHRSKICEGLDSLGIKIDPEKNGRAVGGREEIEISTEDSPIKVLVIPTNEEIVIAEDTMALLEGTYDVHTKFRYSFQKEPGQKPGTK
jgi:acetate kinase